MIVGRWNLDAFLAYIKKQVKEFIQRISSKMLQPATFYHTPLSTAQDTLNKKKQQQKLPQSQLEYCW